MVEGELPMISSHISRSVVLLTLLLLAGCTNKPKAEPSKMQSPSPAISDPTPPAPPNSVEEPADIKHLPTFLLMVMGGLADEGEKEGIEMQENIRLFRTDAAGGEILSFYAKEMKDRGWTTDNQVARSSKVGIAIQEYRRASASEALFLVISEPAPGEISDSADDRRHVALLPAKVKKKISP
jgi:hypothetical protein